MMGIITGFIPALLLMTSVTQAATPPQPSNTDRAAIFKAAGFKLMNGQYVRCEDDPSTASY